jgi:hypothetical protein
MLSFSNIVAGAALLATASAVELEAERYSPRYYSKYRVNRLSSTYGNTDYRYGYCQIHNANELRVTENVLGVDIIR